MHTATEIEAVTVQFTQTITGQINSGVIPARMIYAIVDLSLSKNSTADIPLTLGQTYKLTQKQAIHLMSHLMTQPCVMDVIDVLMQNRSHLECHC